MRLTEELRAPAVAATPSAPPPGYPSMPTSPPAMAAGMYQYPSSSPSPPSSAPQNSVESPRPAYTARTTLPALNVNYLTPQPPGRSTDYPEVVPGHAQIVQSVPLPERNGAFSNLSIQSPRQDVSYITVALLCAARLTLYFASFTKAYILDLNLFSTPHILEEKT